MPRSIEIMHPTNATENDTLAPQAEWPVDAIEVADTEVIQAANAIRLFYYRQIPLLRQIPYLALEANGRGGWLDEYQRAYSECMMAIHKESNGQYDLFIELRTGVILGATSLSCYASSAVGGYEFGDIATWNVAENRDIYTKLAHQRESVRFTPRAVLQEMQELIKKPYHNKPRQVEEALREKANDKVKLDQKMAELSLEKVIDTLRAQDIAI